MAWSLRSVLGRASAATEGSHAPETRDSRPASTAESRSRRRRLLHFEAWSRRGVNRARMEFTWSRWRYTRLSLILLTVLTMLSRVVQGGSLVAAGGASGAEAAEIALSVACLGVNVYVVVLAWGARPSSRYERKRWTWSFLTYWALLGAVLCAEAFSCSELSEEEASSDILCSDIQRDSIPLVTLAAPIIVAGLGSGAMCIPARTSICFALLQTIGMNTLIFVVALPLKSTAFSRIFVGVISVLSVAHIALYSDSLATAMVRSTEQREAERLQVEASRKAELIAEAARAAHEQTMGYILHEVRNPTHAACGALWMLRDMWPENSPQALGRELNCLDAAVAQISSVVDDALDLQRLRGGKFSVRPMRAKVASVMRDVCNQVNRMSPVPLALRMSPCIPNTAYFDPARVRQVLINGLTNAAKFSAHIPIMVLVYPVGTNGLVTARAGTGAGGTSSGSSDGRDSSSSTSQHPDPADAPSPSSAPPDVYDSRQSGCQPAEGWGDSQQGRGLRAGAEAAPSQTSSYYSDDVGSFNSAIAGADPTWICIQVVDGGPGLGGARSDVLFHGYEETTEGSGSRDNRSPSHRPQAATEWAFDPRYALLHSTNTGLGLPLSRQLTDAMGGALHLHDRRLLPRGHPLRASGPVPLSAVASIDDQWSPVEQEGDATADDVVVQVGEVHGSGGEATDRAVAAEGGDPTAGGGAPAGNRVGLTPSPSECPWPPDVGELSGVTSCASVLDSPTGAVYTLLLPVFRTQAAASEAAARYTPSDSGQGGGRTGGQDGSSGKGPSDPAGTTLVATSTTTTQHSGGGGSSSSATVNVLGHAPRASDQVGAQSMQMGSTSLLGSTASMVASASGVGSTERQVALPGDVQTAAPVTSQSDQRPPEPRSPGGAAQAGDGPLEALPSPSSSGPAWRRQPRPSRGISPPGGMRSWPCLEEWEGRSRDVDEEEEERGLPREGARPSPAAQSTAPSVSLAPQSAAEDDGRPRTAPAQPLPAAPVLGIHGTLQSGGPRGDQPCGSTKETCVVRPGVDRYTRVAEGAIVAPRGSSEDQEALRGDPSRAASAFGESGSSASSDASTGGGDGEDRRGTHPGLPSAGVAMQFDTRSEASAEEEHAPSRPRSASSGAALDSARRSAAAQGKDSHRRSMRCSPDALEQGSGQQLYPAESNRRSTGTHDLPALPAGPGATAGGGVQEAGQACGGLPSLPVTLGQEPQQGAGGLPSLPPALGQEPQQGAGGLPSLPPALGQGPHQGGGGLPSLPPALVRPPPSPASTLQTTSPQGSSASAAATAARGGIPSCGTAPVVCVAATAPPNAQVPAPTAFSGPAGPPRTVAPAPGAAAAAPVPTVPPVSSGRQGLPTAPTVLVGGPVAVMGPQVGAAHTEALARPEARGALPAPAGHSADLNLPGPPPGAAHLSSVPVHEAKLDPPRATAGGAARTEGSGAPGMDLSSMGRVLVVDDEPMNRRLLARMLQRLGLQRVESANDGDVALARINEAEQQGDPYVMLFLDIIMRRMNGNAMPSDIEHYVDVGFAATVTKPFSVHELGRTIRRTLGEGR